MNEPKPQPITEAGDVQAEPAEDDAAPKREMSGGLPVHIRTLPADKCVEHYFANVVKMDFSGEMTIERLKENHGILTQEMMPCMARMRHIAIARRSISALRDAQTLAVDCSNLEQAIQGLGRMLQQQDASAGRALVGPDGQPVRSWVEQ